MRLSAQVFHELSPCVRNCSFLFLGCLQHAQSFLFDVRGCVSIQKIAAAAGGARSAGWEPSVDFY
jgi:hypothetical protein